MSATVQPVTATVNLVAYQGPSRFRDLCSRESPQQLRGRVPCRHR